MGAGTGRGIGAGLAGRGRRTLPWAAAAFVAAQLAFLVLVEGRWPELRDPEYALKLKTLRQRIAEGPDRPLLVMLGSSRVGAGFHPEILPPYRAPAGERPLLFNLSKVGSGPVLQLLYLRRLLADGVRPRWVFVEYFPAVWYEAGRLGEQQRLFHDDLRGLRGSDLAAFGSVAGCPARTHAAWLLGRLAPWSSQRGFVFKRFWPAWDSAGPSVDELWLLHDRLGWSNRLLPDEGDHYQPFELARDYYGPVLRDYQLCPSSDRAFRELVAVCRSNGMAVGVVFMPESGPFRGLYAPAAREAARRYMERIRQEHGVPVVDARAWVADSDFIDGFHLHPRGARVFTERMGQEVLRPMLERNGHRP